MYGDKGDFIDSFASRQLYVIRAKSDAKSIAIKRSLAFCRADGTGSTFLMLPIMYSVNDRGEKTWAIASTFAVVYS
jgi:hypothetical protein